jgi:drug/metabolite transporter superfamily protein YnfA
MKEFVYAILAALVLSLLLWLLPILGAHLQAKFSRGLNVTRKWRATYLKKDGTRGDETAELRQVFHWVRGKVRHRALGRTYAAQGRLSVNVLVATYDWIRGRDERTELDCGAFTLKIKGGGQMIGCYSWMDQRDGQPESGEYTWVRM